MTALGSPECPSPATWPFSWSTTVWRSNAPATWAQPVLQAKRWLIAMSASSIAVLNHVTPSTEPDSRVQPTSLKPSKACGPRHSFTSDGQREVVPPEPIRYLEPATLLQVACVAVTMDPAPATASPAGV